MKNFFIIISLLLTSLFVNLSIANAERKSITIGMQLEPPNLNPTGGAAAAIDEVVYSNLFEALTKYGPDGSINPGLAKSWDISSDGLSYTFKLNQNVKFHDGTALTASDVKFSLDRAQKQNCGIKIKREYLNILNLNIY